MPHSSGGGSHGGGSHGGSHGGSGGSGARRHVKNSYFVGARRYVYYRNQRPVYVYADYDITKKPSKLRYLILIVYVPFIISLITMSLSLFAAPKKLKMDYDTKIVIDDRINVLGDTDELYTALEEFQTKTGITPSIMTVDNQSWSYYYNSLENYAYDLYVNAFNDEKHWLIVYSQPEDAREFVDWYFEGMQGDLTDPIITGHVANQFNENCTKYLTANSKYTINQAFTNAFNDITPNIMKKRINGGEIFTYLIFLGFILVHMYFMVFFNPGKKEYYSAKPCDSVKVEEDTCDYCGGIYVIGTCTTCPHCGGALKPHTYYQNNNETTFNQFDYGVK